MRKGGRLERALINSSDVLKPDVRDPLEDVSADVDMADI